MSSQPRPCPPAPSPRGPRKSPGWGPIKPLGPGQVPVTLSVNGKTLKLNLEPRVTLLDALRNYSSLTGTKEVCDRATCGACTVLLDGKPVYSCMKLAIEAQGHDITTVEGLSTDGKLTNVQQALVESDASDVRLLHARFRYDRNLASETESTPDRRRSTCGVFRQLCRCGTQHRMLAAVLRAAGTPVAEDNRGHSRCLAGRQKRTVVGGSTTRIDAPAKVTGAAKYPSDVQPSGWLYGMIYRSRWPAAHVTSVNVDKARKRPRHQGCRGRTRRANERFVSTARNWLPSRAYRSRLVWTLFVLSKSRPRPCHSW